MRGLGLALAILVVASVASVGVVTWGRNSQRQRLRGELALYLERGSVGDLGRAQALGRRLVIADEDDQDAAAGLAFVSAVLAVDYGLDTAAEAQLILERSGLQPVSGQVEARADSVSSPSFALAAAARALVLLRAGDREAAKRVATAAAAATPGTPFPLYALARTRARSGDMSGAARALKAAIVSRPGFTVARVSLAEARLDLGDAAGARAALVEVLASAPDDLRARLLLDEAEQALGVSGTGTLLAACPPQPSWQPRWPPAVIKAGCALADACRSRRAGARAVALARAEEAANLAPLEPRLLARTAQALAQLGAVDRAGTLLTRARRLAAPQSSAVDWATAAVALGRGRAPAPPVGPRPADPETQLLRARLALAAGGVGALVAVLDSAGESALVGDVDLRLLARLRGGSSPVRQGGVAAGEVSLAADDPVGAYVEGLRARLDGNIPAAVASLRHALSGHGDACRAAGEYLTMLRVLKQPIEPASWNLLRAENAACVNLR